MGWWNKHKDVLVFDTEDKVDPYLLSETLVILSLMS